MMHEDDQLAFCPITHILALAFADNAIESEEEVLTPDFFWKLRVPYPLPVLRIRWKQEKQNTPLFQHIGRDAPPDSKKPMSYESAHFSLQRLGKTAGFRHPIKSYCFRRWVANETNGKHRALSPYCLIILVADGPPRFRCPNQRRIKQDFGPQRERNLRETLPIQKRQSKTDDPKHRALKTAY